MNNTHSPSSPQKIAVALSGGVDSAVSAALLQQQGYEVVGFFMKNWSDEEAAQYRKGECPWIEDFEDVKRICHHLDIPYHTFNFEEEYRQKVFSYFLNEYQAGRTPNPDILCNTEIKFKSFLKKALDLGFDAVATGHYAQIEEDDSGDTPLWRLKQGADPNKDQTYFIYHLDQAQLARLKFPIGGLQKSRVRELAESFELPVATKKDSQGLCFIGKIDFPTFLEQYIQHTPGPMVTVEGEHMGEHKGLEYYTMGQRYGLEIGGTGPYYVVDKDITSNTLYICQGSDHPSLFSSWFTVDEEFWNSGVRPAEIFECTVKVRYRSPAIACTVSGDRVELHDPERSVTPGQFAVFYDKDVVLGGGVISSRDIRR